MLSHQIGSQKIGAPTLHAINNAGNYNQGGLIPGRGPNVDTVRTQLREGSFVVQRPAVDAIGANNLHRFIGGYNEGGNVDRRERTRRSGRSGGKTKVTKTDGGSAIVAAAKNAVNTGRRGPASPPCASWVRMVLGMANHPAANQTTSTADLDPQIGPESPYATSLASAASFAGSDLGTVVRNSGSIKPGDIVLHKNTYGNYGPGAITHVSMDFR